MSVTALTPRSHGRWLPRFGLRTLLILVAIFGAGFGYLGHLYRRVQHQRHIVAKIQEAGGTVRYNWQIGMGDHFDPNSNTDFATHSYNELPGGLHEVKRVTSTGTIVQTEKLPGPWILRMLLGNDTFAQVESVDFNRYSHPAEPFDPRLLLELAKLRMLSLVGPQLNDEWLDCVAKIPQLQVLVLSGNAQSTTTSDGLSKLESAPKLESLALFGKWVHDETLDGVANLRHLKILAIDSASVTSGIFTNLGQLTELRELLITHAKNVDDQATQPISRLRNLRVLWLIDTSVSDSTLAHLSGLTQLEHLDLSASNVGDQGMDYLANLSKLKILCLSETHVGDEGLDRISRLPHLHVLRLGKTEATDSGLTAIGRVTRLERLYFWPCNISDDGLSHLRSLTNLKELNIGPKITKEAADELRKALPKCEIRRIDVSGSGYPDG